MEILGYIAYIILVVLALIWAFGVRTHLGIMIHTIIGSLILTLGVIIIPISKIALIHSLWFILLGYLSPLAIANLLGKLDKSKFIAKFFILIGSIYANIVRIGISEEKIKAAQIQYVKAAIEKIL